MRRAAFAFLWIAVSACSHPAARGTPAPAAPRAEVMVLGVYHFDNPNRDYVKTDVDDHRAPRRQTEIADVVARLAAFRPTKIAVEASDGAALAAHYASLRAGGAFDGGEIDQLALRLAVQMGHTEVYAIDHKLDMDLDRVIGAANTSGDRVFLELFQRVLGEVQADQLEQRTRTVRASLVKMNDPAEIARGRDLYLNMARVRSGADFAGADVLAAWYQRNFRIFANVAAVAAAPADRVLVVIGAGHVGILRELIAASPNLRLVEVNDYLR
jgi:hypothetical protein